MNCKIILKFFEKIRKKFTKNEIICYLCKFVMKRNKKYNIICVTAFRLEFIMTVAVEKKKKVVFF